MSKWEYAVIDTGTGPPEKGIDPTVVVSINGKNANSRYVMEKQFYEGEQLHYYLNRAGQEGWRVVGSFGYDNNSIILEREIS